jgi:uncharacterized protein (TIGR02001 family)
MRKLVTSALVATALLPLGVTAQSEVEVTANAGMLSQYYYRGIPQKEASSANGGFDLAAGVFSAGTWAADVNEGAEVDLYASVGIPLGESGILSIGGTGYFYTGDFDNTYLEGNLGLGFGPLSIDAAFGTYDDGNDTKYVYIGVTAEAPNGLFATVGSIAFHDEFGDAFSDVFDNDLAGQYLEAGYGFSAADLDFTISGLWNNSVASFESDDDGPTDEITLIFGVSKTFTIPTG